MLRIKLVKTGKRNRPTWRVVVVEKTKTGKGRVTEYIGNYNPHLSPKEFKLNKERYDYWVGVGAQPTDSVLRLKGRFIDKNKDYQKLVKAKVYKKKVKEEAKKEEIKPAEKPAEEKPKGEAPAVEKPKEGEEKKEVEGEKVEEGSKKEKVAKEKKKDEKPAEEKKEKVKEEKAEEKTLEKVAKGEKK